MSKWYRLASNLAQFQLMIIIYWGISHGVNLICSAHNCLVIPVSPQFPDVIGIRWQGESGPLDISFHHLSISHTTSSNPDIPVSWLEVNSSSHIFITYTQEMLLLSTNYTDMTTITCAPFPIVLIWFTLPLSIWPASQLMAYNDPMHHCTKVIGHQPSSQA